MSTGFPGANVSARGARQAPGTGFVRLRRMRTPRDFACDHCGAAPDWPCVNALGLEVEDHAVRVACVPPVDEPCPDCGGSGLEDWDEPCRHPWHHSPAEVAAAKARRDARVPPVSDGAQAQSSGNSPKAAASTRRGV